MAALSTAAAHHRARVGALSRDRAPNDPELLEAKHSLAVEQLADHVAKIVAEWPPLSPGQVDRIVCLLKAGR